MSSPEPSPSRYDPVRPDLDADPVDPDRLPDPAGTGPDASGVSRRLLLGGGLLVLGAIGGGAVGFARTDPPRRVVPDAVAPADVLAAVDREHALLGQYDAALAAAPADPLLTHIRAEHRAHADALTALLPAGASGSASGSPSSPASSPSAVPPAAAPTVAELVAAEQAAATAAHAACLAGNGTAAVLLACIAASETSHAAVLA